MKIEERDQHLDDVIGIGINEKKPEIIVGEEILPTEQKDNVDEERKIALREVEVRLKNIHQKLEDVLDSHLDVAIDFGRSRDVEAISKLGQTIIDVNKELRETNKDMFGETKVPNKKEVKNTQNNIYVGDTREILDLLKEEEKNEGV